MAWWLDMEGGEGTSDSEKSEGIRTREEGYLWRALHAMDGHNIHTSCGSVSLITTNSRERISWRRTVERSTAVSRRSRCDWTVGERRVQR